MRKMRLVVFAGVSLVGAIGIPAASSAAATQYTIHDTVTEGPDADVNPCTGGAGMFSDTGKVVIHETVNASGGGAFTGTIVGTWAFVGDNAADSASGKLTGWFGGTFNAKGVTQDGGTFAVRGTMADGRRIVVHEVAHETIGADGTVHVSLDRLGMSCG